MQMQTGIESFTHEPVRDIAAESIVKKELDVSKLSDIVHVSEREVNEIIFCIVK